MKPTWVRSRWTMAELKDQSVRYSFPGALPHEPKRPVRLEGTGKFSAIPRMGDHRLLQIEIRPEVSAAGYGQLLAVHQQMADAIVRNEEGDECMFSLIIPP